MYQLAYDPTSRLVTLKVNKVWDAETVGKLAEDLFKLRDRAIERQLVKQGGRVLLILTDLGVQQPSVANAMAWMLPQLGHFVSAVAVVESDGLDERRQARTLLKDDRIRWFTTIEDAMVWLDETDQLGGAH